MISKEEVIKLAKLARLDFSDDELDKIIKRYGRHYRICRHD